jgi:phenylalanyl-tRNA synthetase beta chain
MSDTQVTEHAFDYDALLRRANNNAPVVVVRSARDGEVIQTVDDVEHKLNPNVRVVADTAGSIAIVGGLCSKDVQVTAETTNIFIKVV